MHFGTTAPSDHNTGSAAGRLFWQHTEIPGRTSWHLTVPLNWSFIPYCAEADQQKKLRFYYSSKNFSRSINADNGKCNLQLHSGRLLTHHCPYSWVLLRWHELLSHLTGGGRWILLNPVKHMHLVSAFLQMIFGIWWWGTGMGTGCLVEQKSSQSPGPELVGRTVQAIEDSV